MLNVTITPHREFLPAENAEQKLFIMLKMRPTKQVANSRPSTTFVLLIDTSGSMDEVVIGEPQATGRTYYDDGKEWMEVTGAKSKGDIVIESLLALIHSGKLSQSDRIAIVRFNEQAASIIGLTSATQVKHLEDAIAQLHHCSGGTRIGSGLRQAFHILGEQQMTCLRTLLFTDGQTIDEDLCQELAREFALKNIPITALGVGDFNEDLLNYLSDVTGGRSFHVVTDKTSDIAVSITDLPNKIIEEFSLAQQDVITNLALDVKTVKGVKLTRIVRAYPSQAEFPLHQDTHPLGNASANDETIFILEFTIDSRPASRIRIAQLGLTYDIPSQNKRGELPIQNVIVQFVAGQNFAAQVDQEVMGYIQQCNISQLINEAAKASEIGNFVRAEELLETAQRMTMRVGNEAMTKSLLSAQDELRKTRKISPDTRKTIKMGAKGKTIKMSTSLDDEISEEQMRQVSGT
ncbi:MAG: VWA domain-containing protein [Desmonostoc vinosum HA7617-LM4]|jgi:Ca-activated chloride channel family protein|nr:VWA domain-containing protein [Desmonostoc vinosum HA7617-LM4]